MLSRLTRWPLTAGADPLHAVVRAILTAVSQRGRDPGRTSWNSSRRCAPPARSEEHTSELQSRQYLVCRLLLEKTVNNPRLFGIRSSLSKYNTLPPRATDMTPRTRYIVHHSPTSHRRLLVCVSTLPCINPAGSL